MRKNTLLPTCLLIGFFCFFVNKAGAQSAPPQHAIGLQLDIFEGISDINVFYKKEIKNGWHHRARLGWSSYTATVPLTDVYYNTYRPSLAWGFEKRFQPGKRFHFYVAPELTLAADWSNKAHDRSKTERSFLLGPGLGAGIGMLFELSDRWLLNLETLPTFFYNHVFYDETSNGRFEEYNGLNTDFQGIYVGLSYRFSKEKSHRR
jgi:hypothetical protein